MASTFHLTSLFSKVAYLLACSGKPTSRSRLHNALILSPLLAISFLQLLVVSQSGLAMCGDLRALVPDMTKNKSDTGRAELVFPVPVVTGRGHHDIHGLLQSLCVNGRRAILRFKGVVNFWEVSWVFLSNLCHRQTGAPFIHAGLDIVLLCVKVPTDSSCSLR